MHFDDYQDLAMRTASGVGAIEVAALGLAGEAGEFADHVKKHIAQGHALDEGFLAKELGDILWYVALASTILDRRMCDVAETNIAKLRARYPDGFESERSINR